MLERTIQKRVGDLLKDSRLRKIVAEEIAELCAQKPSGMTIESFGRDVAGLLLRELHDSLLGKCDGSEREAAVSTEHTAPETTESDELDFESILGGLLFGMEHDLMLGNLQMVQALGSAIAQRDTGTSEHNFRVTLSAVRLARKQDFDLENMRAMITGSFLHDVGKIGIPDAILQKAGSLTDEELAVMQSHPVRGWAIVNRAQWLADARDVILHHHEKFDGSGYPAGLAGEQIPLKARIFAIADVFDALTSERPYKPAVVESEAVSMMAEEVGTHFDPVLFSQFCEISHSLYCDITHRSVVQLEETMHQTFVDMFGVDPAGDYWATENQRQYKLQ